MHAHRVSLLALSSEQRFLSPHRAPASALAVCAGRYSSRPSYKLQQTLATYRFPQADTLPLLATLLSLPQPEGAPSLTLSPQKQKQKTQEALVAWLLEEAEKGYRVLAWEDLHWVDPSTLEVLTLLLDQAPTTRLLALLTFRPDFTPPWRPHSHITQLTLSRLQRPQVEAMVAQVTGGKALPAEVCSRSYQDRWGAAVCRRVDQDGAGVRVGTRKGRSL